MTREIIIEGEPVTLIQGEAPKTARIAITIAQLMVAIQMRHPDWSNEQISDVIVDSLTRLRDHIYSELGMGTKVTMGDATAGVPAQKPTTNGDSPPSVPETQ